MLNNTIVASKPGQVLTDDEDLASHGRKKIVVQASVDDLAAKQVHKNPRAAEEDKCAKDQPAVYRRIDLAQHAEVLHLLRVRRKKGEHRQQEERQRHQRIKQKRSTAEKVLPDLETHDRKRLPRP